MKIAVVHDWLIDWAGSERVVAQILQCFPTADVFSLVDFLTPADRQRIGGKTATVTLLQRAPMARTKLHFYLPLMPFAIEQLDVSNYDLVISSSHAVAKGVITGPHQLHLSYVHSPMRYAWDLQAEYLRGKEGRGLTGWALRWILHYLRMWDSRTHYGVDAFVANSGFVAQRIRKVYGREAQVIHPPVDVARFNATEAKEDFYVCVGRLMPYKRTDLVIEAFRNFGNRRLYVLGDGPELKALQRLGSPNIQFLGYQSDQVIQDYLQRARALIFAGTEDFGIVPVEAQACGTPVVAFARGGALETVVPDLTGVLFHEQSPAALRASIEQLERLTSSGAITAAACRRNAERFEEARFRREFSTFVEQQLRLRSALGS